MPEVRQKDSHRFFQMRMVFKSLLASDLGLRISDLD